MYSMYMHGMYMYECMWMCKCTGSKAQTVMYEAVPHLMTVWALQMELDGHSAPLLLITDTCTHARSYLVYMFVLTFPARVYACL